MLASLFSKTKPINYFIIAVLLILFYILFQKTTATVVWTGYEYVKKIGLLGLLMLSTFWVHFVTQKNRLTKDNNYAPLLFVLFLVLFPSVLVNTKLIIANYCIILALRRLFSLHSLKDPKIKIFDASLWIFIASIFHFWSILYVILLAFAILFFVSNDYRNWIIPIIAFITVAIFFSIYILATDTDILRFIDQSTEINFDFTVFDNVYQNIAVAVFSSIALLFFVSQALDLSNKPFNMQTSYKKILVSFLIAVAIYVLSADKNHGVLLFTFFPLSILGANYIESIPNRWFKEVVLSSIVALAFFFYFTQL
ncbi:DUF6427 family protein [Flavobacterium sp. NKUCC04_CG]|uniref:DUF6427 family protein n=1 Tax=Flavobacterium sp. NKUCC04_CG TaxID=2842121 RepID=UPI001C5AE895|nr:DUF6427 family protein [Flavobacterium sp. NKUCC04_CG]MBW3518891.1 hypothetical protein [Flavobacterium sp. NKUCC04_CG]